MHKFMQLNASQTVTRMQQIYIFPSQIQNKIYLTQSCLIQLHSALEKLLTYELLAFLIYVDFKNITFHFYDK